MRLLHRVAAGGALGLFGWAAACANTDTTCADGFTQCGAVCCKGSCNASQNGCEAPPNSSSTSSGIPGRPTTDKQCESEQDFTKRTYCASLQRCVDTQDDDENCGACGNVCGQDTNGNQLTCFAGRCR
ncbi:MAG: hypothetical protein KIT84_36395 [Labilithrix sp.]|nr:hypothetical protein [Labilithrix sp.]MCW5816536.1 hypothetical protein [Labilithrix sp.]